MIFKNHPAFVTLTYKVSGSKHYLHARFLGPVTDVQLCCSPSCLCCRVASEVTCGLPACSSFPLSSSAAFNYQLTLIIPLHRICPANSLHINPHIFFALMAFSSQIMTLYFKNQISIFKIDLVVGKKQKIKNTTSYKVISLPVENHTVVFLPIKTNVLPPTLYSSIYFLVSEAESYLKKFTLKRSTLIVKVTKKLSQSTQQLWFS